MLTQNLVLAGVATFVFFHLNQRQGWYFLDDTQYGLVFVGLALGMTLLERYYGFSTRQTVSEFADQMGLIDNPTLEEAVEKAEHGQHVEACYHTPFKVIRTQYGDRGLLAGYNEHVESFQQGGINEGTPDHNIYLECQGDKIKAEHEKINKGK